MEQRSGRCWLEIVSVQEGTVDRGGMETPLDVCGIPDARCEFIKVVAA